MTNTDTTNPGSGSMDSRTNDDFVNSNADNKTNQYDNEAEIKLERGEELYKTFGFDDQRPVGDKKLIRSISKTEIKDSLNSRSYLSTQKNIKPSLESNTKDLRPLANDYKTYEKSKEEVSNPDDSLVDKRLLKQDTRITIKADNGKFAYQEETFPNHPIRTNYGISEDSKKEKSSYNDLYQDYNIAPSQWPADYELDEIYYGKDTELSLLMDGGYQSKHLSIPSIKTHYKSMEKNKKNKLPLGKIAIGLTAVGALAYILLSKDDDTYF